MSATLINLIIQLLSGAGGSSLLANAVSKLNLGPAGNLITGAIGGVGGGHLLDALLGGGGSTAAAANAASGLDFGSIISQIVGGGVGGGILTAIVGLIRNAMTDKSHA